jgi:hypothetical protein
VGSWGFVEAHLDVGWGFRAVERGGRGWSANLPKICLGPPQDLPSKKDKGAGMLLLQCRGKKKRWLAKTCIT